MFEAISAFFSALFGLGATARDNRKENHNPHYGHEDDYWDKKYKRSRDDEED